MTASGSSQDSPEAIVGALVIDPQDRLLLVRSHKWRGRFGLPGGHVELGETLQEAVLREVKEETGLDARAPRFLCFQEMVFDRQFWRENHFIFFEFICRSDSSDVVLNSEAEEYVWLPPEEALERELDTYTRNAIAEFLRAREDDCGGA